MGRIIAIVICLFSLNLEGYASDRSYDSAENIELRDSALVIVHLHNKSEVKGYVNDWVIGEYIDLRTAWAASFVIWSDRISRVERIKVKRERKKATYNFAETGYYASGKVQYITGNNGERANGKGGYGVSLSVGKRYSRWVAIGLGIGFDKFIHNSGDNLIPLFVEYTSYLQAKNNTLFFNCQTGYSFGFKADTFGVIDAKGGLMIYPSLGVRLGSLETKYTIDFGYRFQKAKFTYEDLWGGGTSEQRLTYKRLALRFGILI